MSEIKEYHSSFTGQEVDALLTKVKDGSITADIEKELAEKANKSGYYPQMSVGQADNLPDRGDVTEGFIGFRESAGAGNSIEDGTANVVELLGESLVWNQILNNEREGTKTINGITIIGNSDGSFTLNGTATADAWIAFTIIDTIDIVSGHKWLYTGCPSGGTASTYCLWEGSGKIQDVGNGGIAVINDTSIFPRILVRKDYTCTNLVFTPRLHDLTKMFQAGNEPTTIDEFNARVNQLVGVDFNAYNEGEVLGVNIKGFKSVNDNAWDEEWESGHIDYNTGVETPDSGRLRTKDYIRVLPNEEYHLSWPTSSNPSDLVVICYDANKAFIQHIGGGSANKTFRIPTNCHYIRLTWDGTTYNHDLCIRLAHSGYKTDYVAHEESESSFDLTKYFPNGMHGLNGVRDSATPKKATRRYGVVDLSSLTWNYYSSSNTSLFKANFGQIKVEGAKVANIICGRYVTVDDQSWQPDKVILATPLSNGMVWIHDEEYKDNLQGFIESLGDLKLIYELATPIETEIDPQLNMNYKVWDFGTEELLTDSKSAPVLARTIYGFNATDTIRGNKAMNENQEARIHTLESEVVRKGDYSPDNSVGFADDLVGRGESVPAEFSFRASGGKSIKDGTARIKRLKGNSMVWNQKMNVAPYWSIQFNNEVFSKSQVGMTYIASCNDFVPTQGDHNAHTFIIETATEFKQGHKYLIVADLKAKYVSDLKFGIYDGADYRIINVGGGSASQCSYIYEPTSTFVSVLMSFDAEVSAEDYEKAQTLELTPRIYDLTKMFQSGNEPRTIEEFYARKPIVEDEYAYNEGEVIHMTAEGIKSVGDNAFDGNLEFGKLDNRGQNEVADNMLRCVNYVRILPNEEYYMSAAKYMSSFVYGYPSFYDENYNFISKIDNVYNTSFITPSNAAYLRFYLYTGTGLGLDYDGVMLTLVHSGWKQDTDAGYQPYWEDRLIFDQRIKDEFPDGMSKWDMAYNKNNKGHVSKGMRVVDLGDMDWSYSRGVFITYLTDMRGLLGQNTAILAKYSASSSIYGEEMYDNVEDKVYKTNGAATGSATSLAISDSSYTDAASFKAAMAGVLLYYQLAEPTIIEYDEPFNLDYRVADFGTEQAITERHSAPISADIIYQFNAVDMIREHELEIAELQSIIATMQAQLASLTSNNVEE